jgi:hypothetical protein
MDYSAAIVLVGSCQCLMILYQPHKLMYTNVSNTKENCELQFTNGKAQGTQFHSLPGHMPS